jgi:hypothetical protein
MSKTLELLKSYAETTKLIQAWYLDKMLESFKDESVPSDFKEMMRATPIDDDKISKMIDGAPRLLFDFFDKNEIIIETVHNGGKWWYSINGASTPNFFSSRKEAEYGSIEEAFQLLNDKIVNSDL